MRVFVSNPFTFFIPQIKRFISYSSFGVLSSFIGFLTVPYLTRVLTPDDFGIVGLFLSVLLFLVPCLSLSSEGLVGIKKVDLSIDKYQVFVNQFISLVFTISLIVFCVCFLLVLIIDKYTLFLLALPFVALLQGLGRLHYIELVQDKKTTSFGLYTITHALILLGATYISISVLHMDWSGRVLAILVAEFILFILRYKYTFDALRGYRFYLTKVFVIEVAKYGFPLFFLLIAAWLLNESDRFIVLKFLSLSDVGIYTASYSLGLAINILNNAMTNTVVPSIYNCLKSGCGRIKLRKINLFYSVFILIISLCASILFYYFGAIILGDEFEKGVLVTCIVLVAFGFNGMYRMVGLPLDYLKKTVLKTINFYIAAVINVSLSIFLIDIYGFLAPAIGTLVSFILLYFLTLHFSLKHTAHLSD